MGTPRSFITLFVLSLLLIGCKNGCTTKHTIDSETKDGKSNGHSYTIQASTIDYRNSKRIKNRLFERRVTHTYALSFDFKNSYYTSGSFYEEPVKDPNNVDLDKELKRTKVKFSKDGQHLALGVDNTIEKIVHFYEKKPIVGFSDPEHSKKGDRWSTLNINKFPSVEYMLVYQLQNNCAGSIMSKQAIARFLDNTNGADSAHQIAIDKWPDCSIAEQYYQPKRVLHFSKNKTWKKRMEKRILEVLDPNMLDDNVLTVARILKSERINNTIDSMLFIDWADSRARTKRLVDRLNDKRNPINKARKNAVISEAKGDFKQFMKDGRSPLRSDAENLAFLLLEMGDTTMTGLFLRDALVNTENYYAYDLMDVIFDNYDLLPLEQKNFLRNNIDVLFENIESYSRSSLFNRVEEILSCNELKALKKKYRRELGNKLLPIRCRRV